MNNNNNNNNNNGNNRRDSTAIRLLLEALATESLVRSGRQYYGLGIPPIQRPQHHHEEQTYFFPESTPTKNFIGFFPFVRKLILYMVTGIVLLFTSLMMYGIFYKLIMPTLFVHEIIYFEYDYNNAGESSSLSIQKHPTMMMTTTTTIPPPITTNSTINAMQCDPPSFNSTNNSTSCNKESDNIPTTTTSTEPLFSSTSATESKEDDNTNNNNNNINNNNTIILIDKKLSPVWGYVDLFSQHSKWDGYYTDVIPHPRTTKRILPSKKPHYIDIVLDFPESSVNKNIGMFTVLVELTSSSGIKLASSIRTVRIPHESYWISIVRKTICLIPIMIGAIQESRRIYIPSYRFYVESSIEPLVRIKQIEEKGRNIHDCSKILTPPSPPSPFHCY